MSSLSSQAEPDIGFITIVCSWVFTAWATLSIGLMIWARKLVPCGVGADDYILVIAFIITIVLVVQTTWAILHEGQDRHLAEIPRTQLALIASSLLANQTLWGLVNTLVRVSVLLFTSRMSAPKSWERVAAYGLINSSVLYGLAIVLEIFLICRPLAAAWDSSITGSCGHELVSYLVLEISGLIIDLGILILPLKVIWPRQLAWGKKVGLGCILSTGALVMIITGLRIQALHIAASSDFTYSKGYLALLSVLGALLSVITCCTPYLRPIFPNLKLRDMLNSIKRSDVYRPWRWRAPTRSLETQESGELHPETECAAHCSV